MLPGPWTGNLLEVLVMNWGFRFFFSEGENSFFHACLASEFNTTRKMKMKNPCRVLATANRSGETKETFASVAMKVNTANTQVAPNRIVMPSSDTSALIFSRMCPFLVSLNLFR